MGVLALACVEGESSFGSCEQLHLPRTAEEDKLIPAWGNSVVILDSFPLSVTNGSDI